MSLRLSIRRCEHKHRQQDEFETITLTVSIAMARPACRYDRRCRSFKCDPFLKQKIHLVAPPSGMTLLETEPARPRHGGKDSALRDWMRALEATAPIAANPQRILPHVIEELAQTRCPNAPTAMPGGRLSKTSARARPSA
jgi:hypothetical protein